MNCRLCKSTRCTTLTIEDARTYCFCETCGLIFVPACGHVTAEEERRRYALHENRPDHEGYVRFLNELADVVVMETPSSGAVLDYGSGPEAVLTRLLTEKGFSCAAYDPHYGIGADALLNTYDTVVLCEVVEHLRDLHKEIAVIKSVAGDSGTIILRTQLYPSLKSFAGWWYKNDITHVNFFGTRTLKKLGALLGREKVMQQGPDIFVL
jgi:hypothetical protein